MTRTKRQQQKLETPQPHTKSLVDNNTFEQSREPAVQSTNMAMVSIKKCGDEGADVGLVDHYLSLGYQFKAESSAGSIEMVIPRERAEAIRQASIAEHYRRVKGAERAAVGNDINLVEDRTERLVPKSAKEFFDRMGLPDDPNG